MIEKSGRPVKVLASFFQPGKDTVESLENHMEPLIEALTAFLREAKLDGIEFDWEDVYKRQKLDIPAKKRYDRGVYF